MFDIILHEKARNEGLTKREAIDLIDTLSDIAFLPLVIDSADGESVAVGFITMEMAEKLDYDWESSGLNDFVGNILADKERDLAVNIYKFKECKIWLTKDEEE